MLVLFLPLVKVRGPRLTPATIEASIKTQMGKLDDLARQANKVLASRSELCPERKMLLSYIKA